MHTAKESCQKKKKKESSQSEVSIWFQAPSEVVLAGLIISECNNFFFFLKIVIKERNRLTQSPVRAVPCVVVLEVDILLVE